MHFQIEVSFWFFPRIPGNRWFGLQTGFSGECKGCSGFSCQLVASIRSLELLQVADDDQFGRFKFRVPQIG